MVTLSFTPAGRTASHRRQWGRRGGSGRPRNSGAETRFWPTTAVVWNQDVAGASVDARFLVGDLPRRSTDPSAVANPGTNRLGYAVSRFARGGPPHPGHPEPGTLVKGSWV
jgi:hypothetical protein